MEKQENVEEGVLSETESTMDLRDFVSVDPIFDGRIILHGRRGEVFVVEVAKMTMVWKDPETGKDMTRQIFV